MTTMGAQTSPTVKQPPHDLLSMTATAKEPGYAFVFLSNEHPHYVDVYFDDVTFSQTPSQIVSSSDYYPFGLAYNQGDRQGGYEQRFMYNSKELQDELNINWYDYGARMYMPEIGRWGVIDPLSEKYRKWSPYNYAVDNPVRFIDPDGMDASSFLENDLNLGRASLVYCDGCSFGQQKQAAPKKSETMEKFEAERNNTLNKLESARQRHLQQGEPNRKSGPKPKLSLYQSFKGTMKGTLSTLGKTYQQVWDGYKSIGNQLVGSVPSAITYDVNYTSSFIKGGSYTFTMNYITRGQYRGFYPTTSFMQLKGVEWGFGLNLGFSYYYGNGDLNPNYLLGSTRSFSIGDGLTGANANYGYTSFSDYTYKPVLSGASGGLGISLGASWGEGETWKGWSLVKPYDNSFEEED